MWSLLEDLTVQAVNAQAIHQGRMFKAARYALGHLGVRGVKEPAG